MTDDIPVLTDNQILRLREPYEPIYAPEAVRYQGWVTVHSGFENAINACTWVVDERGIVTSVADFATHAKLEGTTDSAMQALNCPGSWVSWPSRSHHRSMYEVWVQTPEVVLPADHPSNSRNKAICERYEQELEVWEHYRERKLKLLRDRRLKRLQASLAELQADGAGT